MAQDIVIFLGPTLSKEEAQAHLQAVYLPPVKQGDLISLVSQFRPKIVGIIDGLFHENLSVWHKEILYALQQGTHVFGASSMGALRAAETSQFGMIGIGEIFTQYQNGSLNDDDEVALVHGPEEAGFLPLSLPMINIRATLQEMHNKQLLSKEMHDLLVSISKGLYFPERTLAQITSKARENGVSPALMDAVIAYFESSYVDLKKKDALQLLKTIHEFSLTHLSSFKPSFNFQSTSYVDALYHHDRKIVHEDIDFSLSELVHFSQEKDSNLKTQALNRTLAIRLATLLNIEASEEEVEQEKKQFCSKLRLLSDEELELWLYNNHLAADELHVLLKQEAACRRLQQAFFEADIPWREVKATLDYLKLTGQYEQWVEKKRAADANAQQLKKS